MIVDLFIPCYMDQVFPETANNFVKILEKAGCAVNYNVEQTCCGRPAFADGFIEECKQVGEKLIREFQNERFIVCPGSLCTSMVKTLYPEIFHNSSLHNEYKNVQKYFYEFSDFLVNVLHVTDFGASLNGTAVFHDSCRALHELNIVGAPRQLLQNVKGLTLVEPQGCHECCGFGTSFSEKFENISVDIGKRRLEVLQNAETDFIISTDLSCLMHLQSMASKKEKPQRMMHLADVLMNVQTA